MITNKFGKTFGPVASFSGLVVFCVGLFFAITANIGAIVLVLIGAFIAFTKPYCTINFDDKKVRCGDLIFGFIKTGKWLSVKSDMKIGILSSNKTYRTYNLSLT